MTDKTEKTEAATESKAETASAEAPAKNGRTSVTLSDGRVAVIRKGKGRDMRLAARGVNPASDPIGYAMALAAQLTEIDGNQIVAEDLDEMEMGDVSAIMGAMPGKSLLQGMSSTS